MKTTRPFILDKSNGMPQPRTRMGSNYRDGRYVADKTAKPITVASRRARLIGLLQGVKEAREYAATGKRVGRIYGQESSQFSEGFRQGWNRISRILHRAASGGFHCPSCRADAQVAQ